MQDWECFTLEDLVRPVKVPEATAIPAGRYEVRLTYSNRFKEVLPLLLDVPGFTSIRIHAGNTSEDTSGCILIGKRMVQEYGKRGAYLFQSRFALAQLMRRLQAGGAEHVIEIVEQWKASPPGE